MHRLIWAKAFQRQREMGKREIEKQHHFQHLVPAKLSMNNNNKQRASERASETDRQTDRQTETERHRERERERQRQRDRERQRELRTQNFITQRLRF